MVTKKNKLKRKVDFSFYVSFYFMGFEFKLYANSMLISGWGLLGSVANLLTLSQDLFYLI